MENSSLKYVKMMYEDVTAKIEINGELTEEVETTRAVRQGKEGREFEQV